MGKTITVIGNYSGRNAGDAAILGNLLRDVSELYKDVKFLVPTIKPSFVSTHYKEFDVEPISLMPWNLSLKIFGLPIFRSIMKSDLVMVTDAIMFDRNLLNPIHNYLSTLSLAIPFAKKLGKPRALYNVSLGPITSRLGRACLRRVVENADVLIPRDKESFKVLDDLEISAPEVHMGADCALGTERCSEKRLNEITQTEGLFKSGRPVVGFNINSYIDVYVKNGKAGIGKANFLSIIAETVERIIRDFDVDVVFVVTQVMDLNITKEAIRAISPEARKSVQMISNVDYTYQELASVMSLFEIFVGMRTHSLILSSSMSTPVAGIIAYPKSRGYLESIGQGERLLEFSDFTTDNLFKTVSTVWNGRSVIREELKRIVGEEKKKAKGSAKHLGRFIS